MPIEFQTSVDDLRNQLEQARNSLKSTDENIKRLIGRDPSELPPRNVPLKRPLEDKNLTRTPAKIVRRNELFTNNHDSRRNKSMSESGDNPKRRNPNSVFSRLSDKPVEEEPIRATKGLISKVIVTPKEVPSRQKALEEQSKDVKFKERNKRMFGALLGTLQKFQQEETKQKKRVEKKAQIEKKIEEHEIKEKEEIRKEKQELFYNRRKKQTEIKILELKMLRMREYNTWEEKQRPRANFIMSKAKPHIHFLPKRMNDKTKELLEKSAAEIEKEIERKREAVSEELKKIEERMMRNFEQKFGLKNAKNIEEHEHDVEQDMDIDHHFDLDTIMHSPHNENKDDTNVLKSEVKKVDNHEKKVLKSEIKKVGTKEKTLSAEKSLVEVKGKKSEIGGNTDDTKSSIESSVKQSEKNEDTKSAISKSPERGSEKNERSFSKSPVEVTTRSTDLTMKIDSRTAPISPGRRSTKSRENSGERSRSNSVSKEKQSVIENTETDLRRSKSRSKSPHISGSDKKISESHSASTNNRSKTPEIPSRKSKQIDENIKKPSKSSVTSSSDRESKRTKDIKNKSRSISKSPEKPPKRHPGKKKESEKKKRTARNYSRSSSSSDGSPERNREGVMKSPKKLSRNDKEKRKPIKKRSRHSSSSESGSDSSRNSRSSSSSPDSSDCSPERESKKDELDKQPPRDKKGIDTIKEVPSKDSNELEDKIPIENSKTSLDQVEESAEAQVEDIYSDLPDNKLYQDVGLQSTDGQDGAPSYKSNTDAVFSQNNYQNDHNPQDHFDKSNIDYENGSKASYQNTTYESNTAVEYQSNTSVVLQSYQNDPQGEYQNSLSTNYQNDPRREYQSDPSRDYQSEPSREYQTDPPREYQSDPPREYQSDPPREYQNDPPREYQSDPPREYHNNPVDYRSQRSYSNEPQYENNDSVGNSYANNSNFQQPAPVMSVPTLQQPPSFSNDLNLGHSPFSANINPQFQNNPNVPAHYQNDPNVAPQFPANNQNSFSNMPQNFSVPPPRFGAPQNVPLPTRNIPVPVSYSNESMRYQNNPSFANVNQTYGNQEFASGELSEPGFPPVQRSFQNAPPIRMQFRHTAPPQKPPNPFRGTHNLVSLTQSKEQPFGSQRGRGRGNMFSRDGGT